MVIEDFVGVAKQHRPPQFIQVRGVKKANTLGVSEIRSKDHSMQALAWDELGNVTVLTKGNRVLNLCGDEEIKARGIPFPHGSVGGVQPDLHYKLRDRRLQQNRGGN